MHTRTDSAPRRRGERRDSVTVTAALFAGTFDAPVEVETQDLSPGGMFLASDLLLREGEAVLVSFIVPGTWHRILVDARVVRTELDGVAGMGLAFARLPGAEDKVLRAALGRFRATTVDRVVRDGAMRC